jgi:cystathionine beta-lyase
MTISKKTYLKNALKDYHSRSINPPIIRASTILFKSHQEIRKAQKQKQISYGREGTITTLKLQNLLKNLEKAYHVFLTATGFGAINLAIFSLVRPGDEILVSDSVYSPTRLLTGDFIKEFQIKTIFYDPNNIKDLEKKVSKKTKLIFVENPGSNTFEFQDLKKIISISKKKKLFTIIDNTWGTPYFIQPLNIGFDMSVVAATKYYSGHSDVMGGTLAVNKRVFKYVEKYNKVSGHRLSPDDAYLIIRGLRTLDVRLERHQENTKKIVSFLSKQKKIKEVLYPYKKSSKRYKMWKKYYSGASGLLGLLIKSKNKKNVIKFVNSLKLFGMGYSWGGFESLVLYQDIRELGKREFYNIKKDEHVVRLHIGLEEPKDLINDLKKSLRFVK